MSPDTRLLRIVPSDWALQVENTLAGTHDLTQHVASRFAAWLRLRAAGRAAPVALLVHGASGSGKTVWAQSLAQTAGFPARVVSGAELVQSTDNVERVVSTLAWPAAHSARLTSPALLVIDDVDALLPSRLDETTPTTELRVGATVVRGLRRLQSTCLRHGGMLLLLSARPDHLPQDFLACGDLEAHAFEMTAPNEAQRSAILGRLCCGLQGTHTKELHRLLVTRTQGYQPADLANVVREAILASWNETRMSSTLAPEVSATAVDCALRRCRPAALAGLQSAASGPTFRPWPPIYGCAHVIHRLEDFILNPLRSFAKLSAQGLPPARGLVLHGPSGTGKTTLALSIAQQSGLSTVVVNAATIRSKVIGSSESALARLVAQARAARPSLLLIDQLEVLAPGGCDDEGSGSARLRAALVAHLDSLARMPFGTTEFQGVVVVATTVHLENIHPSVLEPGRLELQIGLPLLDLEGRIECLAQLLREMPFEDVARTEDSIAELAAVSEGMSGAELENACREAAMATLRDEIEATRIPRQRLVHHLAQMKRPR